MKSSSTAHTPLTRPTSPVIVNTPRSREYQPCFLLPRDTSGWFGLIAPVCDCCAKPMYAVVTKSTRPLMVTFGAGVCAKLGTTAAPRMTSIARATTTHDLIVGSSIALSWAVPRHVEERRGRDVTRLLPGGCPPPSTPPTHVPGWRQHVCHSAGP